MKYKARQRKTEAAEQTMPAGVVNSLSLSLVLGDD
jgi:hypothetical protein